MARVKMYPIIEIFGNTIQGEGALIGQQTAFVRFGGCDYRCLAKGTMILRHDLMQTPIENLTPGDAILGYARIASVDEGPLRLVPAVVEAVRQLPAQSTLRLSLDDGTSIVCSSEHRWWTEQLRHGWVWKSP